MIDRKFQIRAVNPINGNTYTENDAFLFCAKDAAVPAALEAYLAKCRELDANGAHLDSVQLLLNRVREFQAEKGARVPDTVGLEINRCIYGDFQSEHSIEQAFPHMKE